MTRRSNRSGRQSSHHRGRPAAPSRSRRGSVIILVVGVLAVIAISAVTYVNIVSLDRKSAAAVSRQVNYQQQADAVMNQIRTLIGADLFGDKIVTNSTPTQINSSANGPRVWPVLFEDGDFGDMAFAYRNAAASPFSGLQTLDPSNADDRVGPRQDAWLASNEPLWLPNAVSTTTWAQLSNLRSGYSFNTQTQRWEYADGKYADLAQWFIQSSNGRGDPGVDLTNFGGNDFTLGLDQAVYDKQISELEPPNNTFNTRDERLFVDTDGDLRPDARWQQLEILGNNAGLIWVTAARVIDASALLNYNASLGFAYGTAGASPPQVSDGRTPADIDFFGLIDRADERAQTIAGNTRVRGDGTLFGYNEHLRNSLQFENAIAQMTITDTTYPDIPGLTTVTPWNSNTLPLLTADQRANWWRWVGSTPHEPKASKGAVHPTRDLIDLCAFWATNHLPIYSSIEQDIDAAYPPFGNINPNSPKGALRAAEDPSFWRSLTNDRPNLRDIKADTRRLLTPYSGSARFSPVPVLNSTEVASPNGPINDFAGAYGMLKLNPNSVVPANAPDIFADFVWALAPLATDEPLMRPFTLADVGPGTTVFNTEDYFYGGGTEGPAKALVGGNTGAVYALRTSLALTANMLDCADGNAEPTVIRFFPRTTETETPLQHNPAFTTNLDPYASTIAIELSDRLPQGDVRAPLTMYPTALGQPTATSDFTTLRTQYESALDTYNGIAGFPGSPPQSAGNDTMTALKKGLTVVGLERQPFLREAFTAALYSDSADPLQPCDLGNADGVIMGDEPMGSLFVVELGNPWDQPISTAEYEIVLPSSPTSITALNAGDAEPLYFRLPAIQIPAGGDAVFYAVAVRSHPLSGDLVDAMVNALPASSGAVIVDAMIPWDIATDMQLATIPNAVMFADIAEKNAGESVPVVMRRLMSRWQDPASTTAMPLFREEWAVVDILEPKAVTAPGDITVEDHFPQALNQLDSIGVAEGATATFGPLFTWAELSTEVASGGGDSRFQLMGTPQPMTGRVTLTSAITRPGTQPNGASFPAYCIEKQDFNLVASINVASLMAEPSDMSPYKQWGWAAAPMPGDPTPIWQRVYTGVNGSTLLCPASWADAGPVALSGVFSDLGEADKYADASTPTYPAFQLYCRDGSDAFPTPASVAQLCTLAHFCVDHELDKLDHWETISEQLAKSANYQFASASTSNPYMATLDISRFILNGNDSMGVVADLPDTMALPPALRVFDCFDTLDSESDLAQGRVNLNTAPIEVLAQLPFLWPREIISDGAGGMLPANGDFDEAAMSSIAPRANMLSQYRDNLFNVLSPNGQTPAVLTGMTGLRAPGSAATNFNTPGIASIGELAVMDSWAAGMNSPNAVGVDLFQSLGIDTTASDGQPFDLTPPPLGFSVYTPQGLANQPADDIEEKLAIFRGMVNCASTRSDVFLAWFIVRGYDPDLIESIEVPGTPAEALNDERFVPTYESRWLCLFDRSNMIRPTDRPKLLMFVELPNAKP